MRHSSVFLIAMSLTVLLISSAFAANEGAGRDFKFMELRRQLRENPTGPGTRERLFAMGEYYFSQQNAAQAADYFRRFEPKTSQSDEDFMATVYLLRCALMVKDSKTALTLEKELLKTLSAHPFFAAFHDTRTQAWTSPLGNRFDFREEVDQLEIKLNGDPFYTIKIF